MASAARLAAAPHELLAQHQSAARAAAVRPERIWHGRIRRFCRARRRAAVLAANLRSLPPRDFYQWVEFCNSPAGTTTLAETRAAQGEKDPLNVRYWGIGNEPWGCGGDFSAEDYAAELRRFTSWVPVSISAAFIGAGPSGPEFEWTRRLLRQAHRREQGLVRRLWGWSVHHYSTNVSGGRSSDWNESKGPAVGSRASSGSSC
jgi:alpha-N-arabinofuranosidase